MKDSKEFLEFFQKMIGPGKLFSTKIAMARALNLNESDAAKLYKFLKGADTQYKAIIDWFCRLGGKVTEPMLETARDVCFVNAKVVPVGEYQEMPPAEDYIAVPLVDEVGAGPGIIPQGEMLSWFLIYKHQDVVRYRRNFVAVRIAKGSTSMEPLLCPGDAVLVDLDDKDTLKPGRIMLVMDPDGSGMIKRVAVEEKNNDFRITFYSDNAAENPPLIYSLREDYGKDWTKVVAGHVVWAWSDISRK